MKHIVQSSKREPDRKSRYCSQNGISFLPKLRKNPLERSQEVEGDECRVEFHGHRASQAIAIHEGRG